LTAERATSESGVLSLYGESGSLSNSSRVNLLLLPSLTQQAQDVPCPSDSVLLSPMVAGRLCQTSRSAQNRGLCFLDSLQQPAPVKLKEGSTVKLFPILLDITRRPGVIGVVPMNRAHIDLRAGMYGGLN